MNSSGFQDWPMFLVSVVQTVLVVISLYFLARQVRQATEATKAEHGRRQQEVTIQFFSEGSQRVYAERLKLESELGSHVFLEPLSEESIEKIEASDELRLAINHMLAFFEDLSTGVNEGVFDLTLADKLLGGVLIQAHGSFVPYVKHFRRLNGSDRYFDQFESLALKLIEMSRDNQRMRRRSKSFVPRSRNTA